MIVQVDNSNKLIAMKRHLMYGYVGLCVLTAVSFVNYYLLSREHGVHINDELDSVIHARHERDVMSIDIPLADVNGIQHGPEPIEVPGFRERENNFTASHQEPTKNIFYVKVHKAGSTTLQNIMFRFALKHNLRVAVFNRMWGMPYPEPPRPEYLYENTTHPQFRRYNMIGDHAVYDRDAVSSYLEPGYESIAILREPYSHLVSAFGFWKLSNRFGLNRVKDPLREFLTKDPNQYRNITPHFNRTKNMQAFHFGHVNYHDNSAASSERLIRSIDEHFRLVMIRERFEESLVLLRRMLNWDFEDILYLEQFVNTARTKAKTRTERDDAVLRDKHKQFAPVDYRLYEHFSKKLDYMIDNEPDGLSDEVRYLKETNRKVAQFCQNVCALFPLESIKNLTVQDILAKLQTSIILPANAWHEELTLSYEKCAYMKFWTFQYHNAFRVDQLPASCPKTSHVGPAVDAPIFNEHDLVKQGYCDKDKHVLFRFPLDVFKEIVLDVPMHPVSNKVIAKSQKCAGRKP